MRFLSIFALLVVLLHGLSAGDGLAQSRKGAQGKAPVKTGAEVKFRLSAVEIAGSTVYSRAYLRRFYRDLIGTEISLGRITAMAREITAQYRNDGYVLSRAIVPPQRVRRGAVRIQIIEGYVSNIFIEGDPVERHGYRTAELFRDWGARIKKSNPLNARVLERYTLLANDLHGVDVKAVLRPSTDVPGAADLVFVFDRKPSILGSTFDLTASFDNRAPKTSGPYRSVVSIAANSLAGRNERIKFIYSAATERNESELFALGIDGMINSEGTALSLLGSRSTSEPGDVLKDLGLKSIAKSGEIGVSHPLIRSRKENLSLTAGFIYRDVTSDALSVRLFEDRLRVLHGGGTYEFVDGWNGSDAIGIGLHGGLDILGASDQGDANLSRENGSGSFFKVTADVSREQPIRYGFSVLVAGKAQIATTALLASEEFSVGGEPFGRAYDPSEITGDHGAATVVELRFSKRPDIPILNFYQLYGFWDFGTTFEIDPINQDATRSAASAGLGVRFGLTKFVSGYLELAKPLTRPVALEGNGKDPRIFFRVSARY